MWAKIMDESFSLEEVCIPYPSGEITVIATIYDNSHFPECDAVIEWKGKRYYWGAFYHTMTESPLNGRDWAKKYFN